MQNANDIYLDDLSFPMGKANDSVYYIFAAGQWMYGDTRTYSVVVVTRAVAERLAQLEKEICLDTDLLASTVRHLLRNGTSMGSLHDSFKILTEPLREYRMLMPLSSRCFESGVGNYKIGDIVEIGTVKLLPSKVYNTG